MYNATRIIIISYLVLVGGPEFVVEHLLVEDWACATGNRWDYPHPISRRSSAQAPFVLQMFHEGIGGRVVIGNCNTLTLGTKY